MEKEKPVVDLPPLTEAEYQQILVEWNATRTAYPQEDCLYELFEDQVERTPETIALVFGEDQLTYTELNTRANYLAHSLRHLGVGPETVVGLCLERSLDLFIALLGILKAGGAYLPLNPSYPEERLAFMVQDAQVSVILTRHHLEELLAKQHVQRICLEEWWAKVPHPPADAVNLVNQARAENLAYVMYTSGSTGTPKGVSVTHRNVVRLVKNTTYASFTEGEVFLQFAPLSFDASTLEIWGCLLNGGRLVLFSDFTPTLYDLAQGLAHYQITTLWLTAGLFHQMVEDQLEDLRHIRQLLAGGDVLSLSHVQRLLSQDYNQTLINGYGPTEGTTFTCCYAMPAGEDQALGTSVPIGRPIANTQVYVLDERGQPVPVGVSGELYIGGDGLARGYLRRPDLTAERFLPHPFSSQPGARVYKTGDVVRYRSDGTLEFLGRADRQVKVRGFRIELGEIEAVLDQHPAIQGAVVLLREDHPGDKRLVAYVVSRQGETVTDDNLRRYIEQHLPQYMLPSAFIRLDTWPLTANGKVDYRALLPPGAERSTPDTPVRAARTPLEEALATIWAAVLNRTHVGIDENFSELGGHSLLATQIMSRIRTNLQVNLPLRVLFDAPTIAQFAKTIEATHQVSQREPGPSLQPVSRDQHTLLPLSSAQQRLWFLAQLMPGNPFYNIAEVWRLEGPLQVSALAHSFNALVERHETLRTIFNSNNGHPVQVIVPTLHLSLPVVDLSGLSAEERETLTQHLRQIHARLSFDLESGPLLYTSLVRLNEREHLLLITLHHIVTDGWSMDILVRELVAGYQAALTGEVSHPNNLSVQYADYAFWQQAWLRDEAMPLQLAYWRQHLKDRPNLTSLPTDRPRPAAQTYWGASHFFSLPLELTHALIELSRGEGVTLFMTLLASFAVLLSRYNGQNDLVIGTPIANRTREEIEGVIGFFVNTLALHLDLSGQPSFYELLQRVREITLGAYAHQDLPFERLVEELQPERSLSYAPLCQVLFALQNTPLTPLSLPGLKVHSLSEDIGVAKFDLSLELTSLEDGLVGKVEYSQDLFEPETIQRLVGHYQTILTAVVTQPTIGIANLPLLSNVEQRTILEEWNATERPYPLEGCVHKLIEMQAERTPEAIALTFGEQQLTYRELNARANQLARYLHQLGVGPETLVGLCLERSFEMVIGLLGILKAGGAYLPLDPAYPSERLDYMLRDAHVAVLLTTSAISQKMVQPTWQERLVVSLDSARTQKLLTQQSILNLFNASEPEHLAYVIYTSGSTGKPKGVQVTQRGLCNLICWHQQAFAVTRQDRATQVASLSFDATGWEIWPYLATGATVCFVEDEVRYSPQQLETWLTAHQITISFLPTPLAESFLETDWSAERTSAGLRMLLTGGDLLRRAPVKDVPFVLVNNYGPTENTVVATSGVVAPMPVETGKPSIGRPIANTYVYTLDRFMQPVPIGVAGELYLGGAGLARGYLGQPELTAERFIPDPFSGQPGMRLYKTGDLVRYRFDGSLDFLRRNDDQVKIRGFRIEPGEIEAVLHQHSGVREAIVMMREDLSGEKRLIAYIVPEPDMPLTLKQLNSYLQARLPHYMIPATIITLEQLPLSPNGKVDRQALPISEISHPEQEASYVAPRTALEETLAGIWAEILHVERVGVHDNFFQLGGHSLLATQVVSRLREAVAVEVPLPVLFQTPTIAALAHYLQQDRQQKQQESVEPVSAIPALSRGHDDAERLLGMLEQFSAAEIDALLNAMLSEQKGKD